MRGFEDQTGTPQSPASDAAGDSDDPQPLATGGSGADRLVSLDFIRGIAVMGILFPNIVGFGHPFIAYFWPMAMVHPPSETDKAFWLFQYLAIDGKFRGMFTLMFGASMMLFMERAWARGADRRLQLRRLMWLLPFGAAHYFLLWRGDILTLYAVWGFAAAAFLRWPARRQLLFGLALYVAGSLMMTFGMGRDWYNATHAEAAATLPADERAELLGAEAKTIREAREETTLYREGSYPDVVHAHVFRYGKEWYGGLIFGFIETLPLMLIGMGLYRFGFFAGAIPAARLRRWGWAGLIAGGLLSLPFGLWAWRGDFAFHDTMFAFNALPHIPRLGMTLGMLALLAAWAPRASAGWLGRRVVATGRMAFTNYLGTSLLMVVLFHGWGLGRFGTMDRVEMLGVVVAMWGLMLAWSQPWLARFRFGPLEWLWRCLTYGRLFPLRRAAA